MVFCGWALSIPRHWPAGHGICYNITIRLSTTICFVSAGHNLPKPLLPSFVTNCHCFCWKLVHLSGWCHKKGFFYCLPPPFFSTQKKTGSFFISQQKAIIDIEIHAAAAVVGQKAVFFFFLCEILPPFCAEASLFDKYDTSQGRSEFWANFVSEW